MARRARRGLADLSDSEEDECKNQSISCTKENSVSLFETKVFTDNVLSKIREEEDKVTNFESLKNIANPNDSITALDGSPDLPLKEKRSSVSCRPSKRCKLVQLLESDEDDNDDELDELLKSTSPTKAPVTPAQRSSEVINLDGDDPEEKNRQGQEVDDEDEAFMNESVDDNDDLAGEDQNDYRILVKHLGVDGSIWVRIKESETMQRLFDETRKATGVGVTLMIDVNGEREEVLPTHTALDLKMSVERCAVVYSYPTSVETEETVKEPKFKLKFVTTNRRATREVACDVNESFAQIFQRYCEQNNLTRSSVVFKFDGDVLDDAQTPQDHDMETGEQIEAHDPAEMLPSASDTGGTEAGRRVSARLRGR